MSLCTSEAKLSSPILPGRSFELIVRSVAQTDGLPFSDVLTAEHIEQAFQAEEISFGTSDDCIYTMPVTLWATLSQAICRGADRSCKATVIRVAMFWAMVRGLQISTDTGAYCRARAKITAKVVQRLAEGAARRAQDSVPAKWKWHGLNVYYGDGATFSMPATEANQEAYPQSTSQAPEVGFPIMRAMAIISMATGMIRGLAEGPYAGKQTGEAALLRKLFGKLKCGDVLLMDRGHCGWLMLALMRAMGIHFVVRLNHNRKSDFSQGRSLGKHDHIVTWPKSPKAPWMDQETYDELPAELEVREVQVRVTIPGFRTRSLVVVTSLLDAQEFTAADIADLYRDRWTVELNLRDIKSSMELAILRCESPKMVRQELWTGLLAYNLIRHSMLQSALLAGRLPQRLSFTTTMQTLTAGWMLASVPPGVQINHAALVQLRIRIGSEQIVGKRPNRVEPRMIKRRHDRYKFLNESRRSAINKLLNSLV